MDRLPVGRARAPADVLLTRETMSSPRGTTSSPISTRADDRPGGPRAPKVWAVGGDGGMGDIGYQNVSKVMLQNRLKAVMLDTQVFEYRRPELRLDAYARRQRHERLGAPPGQGHREEDGGGDLPGRARSPSYPISIANAPKLYKAILGHRVSRHGVPAVLHDAPARARWPTTGLTQAQRAIRARPEFVFNPRPGVKPIRRR